VAGKPIEIVVSLASLADVFLHISISSMGPDVPQDSLVTVQTSVHGLNGQSFVPLDDISGFARPPRPLFSVSLGTQEDSVVPWASNHLIEGNRFSPRDPP